ncbi:beta-lactamase/transpeptidase-like protein [Thelonectria olida]|uniref:Beta-lactamase/transpeptidase-like protein n=1 Tax=Thelonectria olida TaxID=1576542 RepID=A0A9P9ATU9_9HYPO|nr:beta-lactamase/transpeptidase-like protein [Thelonectria olida]
MDLFSSPDFSAHVNDLIRRHHVPGISIAVAQNDQVASAGYGSASLDSESETPCTADTLFDVGSSAKSLTAAAIALLVDDDQKYPHIHYDAVMSKLLPDDFVMSDAAYTDNVTLDDMLGHRTGMPGHNDSYLGVRAAEPDNARSITRNLRNLPVTAPLRSRYLYCNMMYTVATHLIEVETQQTFADFLQDRLLEQLDMTSTSLQPSRVREKGLGDRLATGYFWDKAASSYRGIPSQDCPEGQGAGSVISSANDFIKWVKGLMNREGPINENVYQGLLRLRSFKNPNARKLKPFTSPAFYAAGLEIYYYRGHAVVWHNGSVAGFGSRFFFLPDFSFGAVILGNSEGVGPVGAMLAQELIDEVLQVPATERSHQNQGPRVREGTQENLAVRPKKNKNKKQGQPKPKVMSDKAEKGAAASAAREGMENAKPKGVVGLKDKEPQEIALDAYTGVFWHAGYRGMMVEVNDGRLFIDASDRSLGFTLTFAHQSGQTKYTAHLRDLLEDGDDPVAAEFVIEDGKVVRMGLKLENVIDELIWFDRVE